MFLTYFWILAGMLVLGHYVKIKRGAEVLMMYLVDDTFGLEKIVCQNSGTYRFGVGIPQIKTIMGRIVRSDVAGTLVLTKERIWYGSYWISLFCFSMNIPFEIFLKDIVSVEVIEGKGRDHLKIDYNKDGQRKNVIWVLEGAEGWKRAIDRIRTE